MKTLFLIRHAKSSWDDTALTDKDRPLGDRGRRDAPKMGKRLTKRDVKPDLILSSPATRALTTAEIIAKKLDYKRKDIFFFSSRRRHTIFDCDWSSDVCSSD